MMIISMDVLKRRAIDVYEAIKKDDRYVACIDFLGDFISECDSMDSDIRSVKKYVAANLHEADGQYPMHPEVAKLIIDIYNDGIEEDDADSWVDMGTLYYTGRAGEQDYKKAAYYYDKADKLGSRQATENLGYIYYYGRIGEKDYEKAFKYFVKGALDGHLCSLYKTGDFYKNGYFVEKDPKEAFIIYAHCVEMLTEEAIPRVGADIYMRMGDCLYQGFGVEKDLMAAQRFMSLAENLFYKRLMEGDFYQKRNLEHVLDVQSKIRKEIQEEMLPDLSWAGYDD